MVQRFLTEDAIYIIAEVGQNHQGDLETAREYIKIFADAGAQAIKFQVRNLTTLFSQEALDRPYDSENSFGATYGEHRRHLELGRTELEILKTDCGNRGVDFMATAFDESSVDLLVELQADVLKIASFDLGNLPLIRYFARSNLPVIMSVGGGDDEEIDASVKELLRSNAPVSILHCVSEYPCSFDRLSLGRIRTLRERYPTLTVGLSDHFNGILSGPLGYVSGAQIFEKHVTLNRSWRGTDHSFALEPEGFRRFVRDIKRVTPMLSSHLKADVGHEAVFKKLGKSIIYAIDASKGKVLEVDDLTSRILTDDGVPVRQIRRFLGQRLKRSVLKGEVLRDTDFK